MENIRQMGNSQQRKVATIGTFDGLHRGHRRVIDTVKSEAAARGLTPVVISFDRHPLETIAPERAPGLIQSPSQRSNALYREGLTLLTLEFTPALAATTAAELMRKIHDDYGVDVLVVGYDNTFGCDGVNMNIADYRRLGAEVGVEVVEAPYEPAAASSKIRHLLRDGNIEEANRLLDRPFEIVGEVVAGKRLGSSLGYPTANISPYYKTVLPKNGVYSVDVEMEDGRLLRGVANVGHQPTMAESAPIRLEVHIPGLHEDLYGSRLGVRFLRRIRDEKKFDSPEELRRRIRADITESLA